MTWNWKSVGHGRCASLIIAVNTNVCPKHRIFQLCSLWTLDTVDFVVGLLDWNELSIVLIVAFDHLKPRVSLLGFRLPLYHSRADPKRLWCINALYMTAEQPQHSKHHVTFVLVYGIWHIMTYHDYDILGVATLWTFCQESASPKSAPMSISVIVQRLNCWKHLCAKAVKILHFLSLVLLCQSWRFGLPHAKLDVQRLKLSRFLECVFPESIASLILLGARCFSNSWLCRTEWKQWKNRDTCQNGRECGLRDADFRENGPTLHAWFWSVLNWSQLQLIDIWSLWKAELRQELSQHFASEFNIIH